MHAGRKVGTFWEKFVRFDLKIIHSDAKQRMLFDHSNCGILIDRSFGICALYECIVVHDTAAGGYLRIKEVEAQAAHCDKSTDELQNTFTSFRILCLKEEPDACSYAQCDEG